MRPVRLLLFVSLFLVACGATQRERTVKATLAAVNEARDAFVAFDNAAQQTIIAIAPSYEKGLAALLVYRKRREFVVEAFASAYRAIAAAAATDDAPTAIADMIAAAQHLHGAFNALKATETTP